MKSAELARLIKRSRSYLCRVQSGDKKLGVPAAIAIWAKTTHKIGPIANTSDADIRALARFHGVAL